MMKYEIYMLQFVLCGSLDRNISRFKILGGHRRAMKNLDLSGSAQYNIAEISFLSELIVNFCLLEKEMRVLIQCPQSVSVLCMSLVLRTWRWSTTVLHLHKVPAVFEQTRKPS